MYEQRVNRFLTYMDKEKIEVAFVSLPRTVYYFTGYLTNPHERFYGLLLQRGKEPAFIMPELDYENAIQKSVIKNIFTYKDADNPLSILQDLLPKHIVKFGIQKEHLSLLRFNQIQSITEVDLYIDIESKVNQMIQIKTEKEIEKIKKAIQITEDALKESLKTIEVGISEYDIAAEIIYQRLKRGADGGGVMVVSGEKSALPHGRTGSRRLREGDFLLIDGGVIKDGYVSDITRTFAIGKIDEEKRKIYDTVLKANQAAIRAIQLGIPFGKLDQIARGIIEKEGYGKYFNHRLGHGMGMHNHELPSIHSLNTEVIKENMVFTVEPGIYIPQLGGVRIEDDLLVRSSGYEVLTSFSKELIIL